jgi:hypothetical protein
MPLTGPSRRWLRTGQLGGRRAFLTRVASDPGILARMARYLGHGRRKGLALILLRSQSDLDPLA